MSENPRLDGGAVELKAGPEINLPDEVLQPALFDIPIALPAIAAEQAESTATMPAPGGAPASVPAPGVVPASTPGGAPVPAPGPGTALAVAAAGFDDHLARLGKTANTRRGFASDLRLVAQYLGADRAIGTIGAPDLDAFLVWLLKYRGPACSPKSYARRVTTIKVFFAWLAESGAIPADPARGIVHRRAEPPLPQVLSDGEVARLLAEAQARLSASPPDPRPVLLLRLLLDTGLKKGELTRLRAADLAPEADPPTLLVRYDDPRWQDKERRVAFSPQVRPLLGAYLARYQCGDRLFGCTDRNLEYILADLVRAAGLPAHIGFETLRWTSALRTWRAGVDPELLRAQLGLSPITWATTERKLELLDSGSGGRVERYFAAPGA